MPDLPELSLGYVYLPALVGITLTCLPQNFGATAANSLPVPILKRFCLLITCDGSEDFLKVKTL